MRPKLLAPILFECLCAAATTAQQVAPKKPAADDAAAARALAVIERALRLLDSPQP